MSTATQEVLISAKNGFHARPASAIVAAARAHTARVTLSTASGAETPAASILGIIGLGIGDGDVITVTADGDDAATAVAAVSEVLATPFD